MLLTIVLAATAGAVPSFAYDATAPTNLRASGDAVTFSGAHGRTVSGVLYRAATPGRHAAVLFVHWLGDPATTNHREFDADARALTARGADCLLVDAMWSKPDWFETGRSPGTDARDSIDQVIDLRRALDVLLALPDVDPARVAYAGHDFGAMYGAVLAGVDARPRYFVLMAGVDSFSQWYLLGKKPENVAAYEAQMAPFAPSRWLAQSTALGFLFQFSLRDRYVGAEQSAALWQAAPLPRGVFYYKSDHRLEVPEAHADRLAWLAEKLGLQ
jgi:dienelactone hydrolase